MKGQRVVGTGTGTGAAINIACGFQPDFVHVVNLTSRDEMMWFQGMTAAHAFKRVAAGTGTAITSLGISMYAGVDGTTAEGFTIGADTDVNVAAETYYYIAWSEDD